MSRLKPFAPFVLVAWTLVLWTGRLQLAWTVTDDSTTAKMIATVPVVIFVILALVAAIALLRRNECSDEDAPVDRSVIRAWRAVWVLVVWTIGYWFVRLPIILADAHDLPFKAVHAVLAVLSWIAAGWVGSRTLWGRGIDAPGSGLVLPRPEMELDGHR